VAGKVGVVEGTGVSVPMRMDGSGNSVGSTPTLQPENRPVAAIIMVINNRFHRIILE
jgi:hypothetical protein